MFPHVEPQNKNDVSMFLFDKDPTRKQRLPFLVSRDRLEAALDQLSKPAAEGGHEAFQYDRLVQNGLVPINRANLEEYSKSECEPPGLDVVELDQRSGWTIDTTLLDKWLSGNHPLQLNVIFEAHFAGQWQEPLPSTEQDFLTDHFVKHQQNS